MDIQAASNFERYLYYLLDKNPTRTKEAMTDFAENGRLDLKNLGDQIKRDFAASAVTEEEVEQTIRQFKEDNNYLLDPHTAVGVFAGLKHQQKNIPMICLATAHPAKFGEIVKKATGMEPPQPDILKGLFTLETRCERMPANADSIKAFIRDNALTGKPADEQ
jgi:threonine synthase